MDEQSLNEKLAEWAGFEFKEVKFDGADSCGVPIPQWLGVDYGSWEPPNFTQSLDACFKWLVPKLLEQLDPDTIKVELKYGRTKEMVWTFLFEDWQAHSYHYAQAETPALALCLAIEKLIDKEV